MMEKLSLIAAFAHDRVIGRDNDLPWDIPDDMEHFRSVTRGKPLIMGRMTFESILKRKGEPLPGRPHFVVTHQGMDYTHERVEICSSLENALTQARARYLDQEIMIIGGAKIYAQSITLVDRMYLTEIDLDVEGGDAFFPEFSYKDWVVTHKVTHSERSPAYTFLTLDRKP